jgi:hypothetical protein
MNSTNTSLAINAAAGVLGTFLVAYVAHDLWSTSATPICHKRFEPQIAFGLRSNLNVPLTPAELQARVGHEYGVIRNTSVVEVANAPATHVLAVKLPKGMGSVFNDPTKAGGVSFRWDPRGMGGSESACLSYQVRLPENFDFGSAGVLPGLYGGGTKYNPKSAADGQNGFATRVAWSALGDGSIKLQIPNDDANSLTSLAGTSSFELQKGKWVALEQEIILNTPNKPDGVLRLWVNGELKIDMTDVIWRKDQRLTLSGVLNDVSYGSIDSDASAPADAVVDLTPLMVSWKEIKVVQ